jgi:hypothetical protein
MVQHGVLSGCGLSLMFIFGVVFDDSREMDYFRSTFSKIGCGAIFHRPLNRQTS